MAEEYGETQSWPVRPPDSVDTETRCGDSGHSVGGLPCRLTIVGGVREAWSVWRRGRVGTVCARGACPAWSSGPSTSPLGAMTAMTTRIHATIGAMALLLFARPAPAPIVGAFSGLSNLIAASE